MRYFFFKKNVIGLEQDSGVTYFYATDVPFLMPSLCCNGDGFHIVAPSFFVVCRFYFRYGLPLVGPKLIGRLEVGSETVIDKGKSIKTWLMQIFEVCSPNSVKSSKLHPHISRNIVFICSTTSFSKNVPKSLAHLFSQKVNFCRLLSTKCRKMAILTLKELTPAMLVTVELLPC